MRASFAKIMGASALLALGSACGGSVVNDHDAGGAGNGSAGLGVAGSSGSGPASGGSETAGSAGELSAGAGDTAGAGNTAGTGGAPPVDIGPQARAQKLDVLFVVDNSTSMADKQGVLSASVPAFVSRLVNPHCVDAQGAPVAAQPASGAAACASGTREFTPVSDLHLGVITTSIGSHGGTVCAPGSSMGAIDDQAELLPAKRDGVPSYPGADFLSYDVNGKTGVADATAVASDLQKTIAAVGQNGCGFEAPLEAMYRFLVDPEPPISVTQVNGQSTPQGINDVLLKERSSFLRPDSAVAVVILTDENDCSIVDDGVGWFVGASSRMPRATAACATNPNDPCCRSCAQRETAPPKGCTALSEDSVCKNVPSGTQYATWDAANDSLNLRCFDQVRRFGFDLLYPVERYSNALSNPQVPNRAGALVDNPLLVGGRSATLISVSTIIGAPWQDLATKDSLGSGRPLEFLGGAGLVANKRYSLLLGDPPNNVPPADPFMVEGIDPRSGQNPLTGDKIAPASSQNPAANAINGHEQNVPNQDDLQYACTFALPTPKACAPGDLGCDCSPDKNDNLDEVTQSNSPVCQPPGGGPAGPTQYYAKAYPGARELRLAQLLGERSTPASICPKELSDTANTDYAYTPALNALITRIAGTLQ